MLVQQMLRPFLKVLRMKPFWYQEKSLAGSPGACVLVRHCPCELERIAGLLGIVHDKGKGVA